jgi:hypothetical protein
MVGAALLDFDDFWLGFLKCPTTITKLPGVTNEKSMRMLTCSNHQNEACENYPF